MGDAGKLRRIPSLAGTVLTFVLAGPFIAGFVGVAVLESLGDDASSTAHSGPNPVSKALSFGLGWWLSIFRGSFFGPRGLFFTIIPTVLAAVIYWALTRLELSSRPLSNRLVVIALGGVTGVVAAFLGWVGAMTIEFKFDLVTALGSLLFSGAMVLPTGAILGLLIGSWSSGERPNSTVERDGKLPPI